MNLALRIANDSDSPVFTAELVSAVRNTHQSDHVCLAEEIKLAMRKRYQGREANSYTDAMFQMKDFWTKYENVNRVICPDDPVYSIINSGTALSTTNTALEMTAAASGQVRVLEIIIGGEATSSAVNRVVFQRSGALTSPTAITAEKFNTRSAAAAGTYGKNSTSTLSGNPALVFAFNAFGGMIDWKAAPGEEIYLVNSEIAALRSASGTSTVSSTIVFEEL